jgi:hypothetical protein
MATSNVSRTMTGGPITINGDITAHQEAKMRNLIRAEMRLAMGT